MAAPPTGPRSLCCAHARVPGPGRRSYLFFRDSLTLPDMDGNWLQWGVRLNEILLRLGPSCPIVDDDKRTGWDDLVGAGVAPGLQREALNHPDLYLDLEPFPYSVEAIHEMADEGFTVFHCSTPTWSNPGCVPESWQPSTSTLDRRRWTGSS